jgi:AraC family transcriptional regulator
VATSHLINVVPSTQEQSAEIRAVLVESTLAGPSSVPLGWHGIAVERRIIPLGEIPELPIHQHFLLLWDSNAARGERQHRPGQFVPYWKLPNTISTLPPGVRSAYRHATENKVVVCAMPQQFLDGVEEELDHRPSGTIHGLYGTDDPTLRDLILLLAKEADAGGPTGKVYAESLSTALATRLLFAGRSLQQPGEAAMSPLPRRILRRVLDRMEAQFDSDLTLTLLAGESGYSRTHFLRMFRRATGQSPHRYLLDLRLRKAESMLASHSESLVDIALACGFSSHAHFSTAFRSRYGLSPAAYRRRAWNSPGPIAVIA